MKTPGQLIREARIRQGVSQDAVASAIGKTKSLVCLFETGRERIAYRHLSKIAAFLRIDFNELQRAWLDELENQPANKRKDESL